MSDFTGMEWAMLWAGIFICYLVNDGLRGIGLWIIARTLDEQARPPDE